MEMRPRTYPQAKRYLMKIGVWHRNFQYYDGGAVLNIAQTEYDKRKLT